MKKSLLALAVLGAFAGVASAQSSVTLSGTIDVNARYVDNGGRSVYSLSTDGINSSELRFRAIEDLGGGLKAGIQLQMGINPDTGTTTTTTANNANVTSATAGLNNGGTTYSKLFNRRATVSLYSGMGELRLGRDYTPTFWNLTIFDPFGTNGVGALTNIILGANFSTVGASTLVRADNSIGYFLPAGLGGFYGQFMVAAGEGQQQGNRNASANPTQAFNKNISGRLGYAAGPFDFAGSYGENTDIVSTVGNGTFKQWNLGGSWDFGMAKVTGQYAEFQFNQAKQVIYQAGLIVPLGLGEFHASYSAADGKGNLGGVNVDPNNARQYALGYVYNMSKRTAVYGTYSQINNDGLNAAAVATNPAMTAGATSKGYEFGIRHNF